MRKFFLYLSALVAGVLGMASVASAEPTTGVETAISDGFGEMTSLITTTLVPLLFGIVILGLGIAVGVKWMRKGVKQA